MTLVKHRIRYTRKTNVRNVRTQNKDITKQNSVYTYHIRYPLISRERYNLVFHKKWQFFHPFLSLPTN